MMLRGLLLPVMRGVLFLCRGSLYVGGMLKVQNISNSAGHDKDKLHATILFLRWMRNMFSDYVDDPELISALQCYIHTILRISLHKHYNICGLWGVSMALGRFNKRAAFTTFFRNFRLFS